MAVSEVSQVTLGCEHPNSNCNSLEQEKLLIFVFEFIFCLLMCEFQQAAILSLSQFPIFKRVNNNFVLHEVVKRIKLRNMGLETQEALNNC